MPIFKTKSTNGSCASACVFVVERARPCVRGCVRLLSATSHIVKKKKKKKKDKKKRQTDNRFVRMLPMSTGTSTGNVL